MTIRKLLITAAALPLAALPSVAYAEEDSEEEASGPFTIEGEIGAFSDYRFRGISLSGKDPELTAELTVSHESGFYVSAWASNVDADFDGKGNDLEVDWSAGWSKDIGNVNFDIGAIYYSYLDHSGSNYIEFYSSLSVPVGAGSITVGGAYAPKQDNLLGSDNTYVYISGDMPIKDTPLSLHGTFGYEDGAFGSDKKDWQIGASYDLGRGFTASVDYVDTAHSFTTLGDATVLGSLTWSF
jgi:uncharacterized protein (TIGR02001 family)